MVVVWGERLGAGVGCLGRMQGAGGGCLGGMQGAGGGDRVVDS